MKISQSYRNFRNICEMENFRYIALHSEISLCSENLYGQSPPQKTKLCTISKKKIIFLLFLFLFFLYIYIYCIFLVLFFLFL